MSDIRKILNTLTEMTSGSVASVSMPLTTQRRQDHVDENDAKSNTPEVLEYGNWENSSLTTSKKLKQTRGKAKKLVKKIYGEDTTTESMDGVAPSTKMFTSEGKTKNPVARAAQRVAKGSGKHKNPAKVLPRKAKHKKMYEEEITEQDLIISPVIRRVKDRDLISRDHSRVDHEVEMARGDLHQSQQNAAKILKMIQNTSEQEGLEGWVQEKIIKASDYLNTVREYLENKGQQGVAEGSVDSKYPHGEVKYRIVYRKSGEKVEGVKSFASKADAQQYAAKDPQYSVQAYRVKQGVAEGSDNLNYIGNCTDDDVIEHIFGDATHFAQAVEEHGDEFTIGDLVVKYDPDTDVHSFYYKKQGVAEGSEQVFKVVAVSKSNALEKPTTLNVKASSLDEVFERLAINDWYPLEINGVEVINGKRLKQGVAEGLTKQARAKKEAESVKAVIARLEQELKDTNPHIDKDDIRRRLETERRRLELYRDVLDDKDVTEGFSDVVKGIKRSIKGKEHPDVVASKHAGRAIGHYNQGDIAAGDKETERYVKTRDMHLKAKGVAEDLDANQRRVGQLGPTEKIGKRGTRGRLVGGN